MTDAWVHGEYNQVIRVMVTCGGSDVRTEVMTDVRLRN